MIPKYLYQYTDIDALEKIYTNKEVLFKRLDLLNDPYEEIVEDDSGFKIENARKNVYCSCWTADENESIAMWGVYKDFSGLRIKMSSMMFSKSFSLKDIGEGYIPVQALKKKVETGVRRTIGNDLVSINKVYGPYAIQYVSNIKELFNGAIYDASHIGFSEIEGAKDIELLELGNRKIDYWKYENEWRFKISPYLHILGKPEVLKTSGKEEMYEDYYLVPFEEDIEEILLSPCIQEDTISRLHTLLGAEYDRLVKNSKIRMQKM